MNDLVVSSDKHFKTTLFGLNKGEVYAYLNQIGSAYEELQLQIQVLRDQNDKLADSNRDNALKLYNLQNEMTENQKKYDRVVLERDAAKKEAEALHKELDDAGRRITKLTDELIKTGADIPSEVIKDNSEIKITADDLKAFTPKPIFGDEPAKEAPKAEAPKIKLETPEPEPVKEEPKKEESIFFMSSEKKAEEKPKDIFAEMKASVKEEQAAEEAARTASSASVFEDDEVYAGEVEVKVDESMLIGNDDDDDEGFTFL